VAQCIFALLQHYNVGNSQRFTVTLLSLWKHRNTKLWQDFDETVAQAINGVPHLIEDWTSANSINQHTTPPAPPPLHGLPRAQHGTAPTASSTTAWQRPPHGRLKCNVDASFFETLNKTGIRM
jgi:hypothetical protein